MHHREPKRRRLFHLSPANRAGFGGVPCPLGSLSKGITAENPNCSNGSHLSYRDTPVHPMNDSRSIWQMPSMPVRSMSITDTSIPNCRRGIRTQRSRCACAFNYQARQPKLFFTSEEHKHPAAARGARSRGNGSPYRSGESGFAVLPRLDRMLRAKHQPGVAICDSSLSHLPAGLGVHAKRCAEGLSGTFAEPGGA